MKGTGENQTAEGSCVELSLSLPVPKDIVARALREWQQENPLQTLDGLTNEEIARRMALLIEVKHTGVGDQRLYREDFEIQLDAAKASVRRGHYAAARGELNGAVMILKAMEKRDDR